MKPTFSAHTFREPPDLLLELDPVGDQPGLAFYFVNAGYWGAKNHGKDGREIRIYATMQAGSRVAARKIAVWPLLYFRQLVTHPTPIRLEAKYRDETATGCGRHSTCHCKRCRGTNARRLVDVPMSAVFACAVKLDQLTEAGKVAPA